MVPELSGRSDMESFDKSIQIGKNGRLRRARYPSSVPGISGFLERAYQTDQNRGIRIAS